MATLTVIPVPVMQFFADLTGAPLAGGKVYTYVAGTTTPRATYTDVGGLVPNTNPIILDAFGKAVIYLSATSYKFDVQNAAGVSQSGYPRDNIIGAAPATILGNVLYTFPAADGTVGQFLQTNGSAVLSWATPTLPIVSINNFRLTLTTGVPVTTADVLAATTLFATPCGAGNQIALFDSSGTPTLVTSAQFSIAVPATTSQLYDVFCYNNAGVATLELLAWTNDTTRATALTLATTGVYTKTADLTRRYLGSVRTTTVSGQTEDSIAKRYVWNYSNRALRVGRVLEATASWAYSITTWRQARATATNQLDFVIGIADGPIQVTVLATASSTALDNAFVSIGEDSTTTPSANAIYARTSEVSSGIQINPTATLLTYPAVGRHTYVWLEQAGAGGTMTWVGVNSGAAAAQSGIIGSLLG